MNRREVGAKNPTFEADWASGREATVADGLRYHATACHLARMVIEKRSRAPPDGVPILPWFEGAFSRAFIALHPFVFVEGLDPASTESGGLHLNAGDRPGGQDLIEWAARERDAHLRGKELRFGSVQDIIKRFGEPVRWGAMRRHLDLADHRDIDRALRTQIGGLREPFGDLGDLAAEILLGRRARHDDGEQHPFPADRPA